MHGKTVLRRKSDGREGDGVRKKTLTVLSVLVLLILFLAASGVKAGAKKTLLEVLGVDPQTYISYVEKYSASGNPYYLGTPYPTPEEEKIYGGGCADFRSPNGDRWQDGLNRMQCTGFIWHVLVSCGAAEAETPHLGMRSPYYAQRPYRLQGWYTWMQENDVSYRHFASKSDMLASGELQYGDLIWIWDEAAGGKGSISDYHHIGIYVGDGSSDRMWHSDESGNHISEIKGKVADVSYTVVNTVEPGRLKLKKVSARPDMSEGNPGYSLRGAEYGVYRDEKCTDQAGTLVTGEDGATQEIRLNAGMYYVKEIKAPPGFALDPQVYKILLAAQETAVLELEDQPQSAPVDILLKKTDSETEEAKPRGNASVEGAEFTIRYYTEVSDTDPAGSGAKPGRTWVLRADAEGMVRLREDHKISGDEFFYNSKGSPCLPLGTVTIQETRAPEGYLLNEEVFVRTITPEGTQENLTTYQIPTVPEEIIRGDIRLVKFRDEEDRDQKIPLEGIVFEIISKTTEEKTEIITDENGYASTCGRREDGRGGLIYGTYTVHEKESPQGLAPVEDFEVTISEEGKIHYYILEDRQIMSPVRLVKTDSTSGEVIPLSGAEFELLDEEKHVIAMTTYYPDETEHTTWKTDENGSFILPEKLGVGVYYFREVKAPAGYLKGGDLRFEITEDHQWDEPFVVEYADNPAMGRIRIVKTDCDSGKPLAGARFAVIAAEDIITPDKTVRMQAGEQAGILVTDESGTACSEDLFLGKYTLRECAQPAGYVLEEEEWNVELAYKDQETEIVTEQADIENQPTTAVIEKRKAGTEEMLPGVTFSVWIKGAEDRKVSYTTDENGQITLSGILPGTYCVQETEAPPGYLRDASVWEFTVGEDGRIEGEGKKIFAVEDQWTRILDTTACWKNSRTKEARPGEEDTIVDTVFIEHMEEGKEYTLKGVVVDPETRRILTLNGQPVAAKRTWTARRAAESVKMEYPLDTSYFPGKSMVIFEYLYLGDVLISSHENPDDQDQTVSVLQKPAASVKTGDTEAAQAAAAVCAAVAASGLYCAVRSRRKRRRHGRTK